jgi:hypothetical protein
MLSRGPSVLVRLVGRHFSLRLLAHRAVLDCSLPLAATFAWLPPSSSELTERKALFRHLLLQIGGANIEDPPIPDARSRLTSQELPTMCSMIAVVETDGVRGRYTT